MIRSMVADEMYYPGSPEELRRQIQHTLTTIAAPTRSSNVVVAPYGAYDLTLSYVMQALRTTVTEQPETVVLIAPPNATAPGRALLPESSGFATPFGVLPVDQPALSRLAATSSVFEIDEFAHLRDHSIETMLPPIQYLFGPVPIIPILVGTLSPGVLHQVARGLQTSLLGRRYVTVISANLSGFTTLRRADARARSIIRMLFNSPGETVLATMETLEDPPRSLYPIILGHLLAGTPTRPSILMRGTFETEYEGDTGSVVFAAIAYT